MPRRSLRSIAGLIANGKRRKGRKTAKRRSTSTRRRKGRKTAKRRSTSTRRRKGRKTAKRRSTSSRRRKGRKTAKRRTSTRRRRSKARRGKARRRRSAFRGRARGKGSVKRRWRRSIGKRRGYARRRVRVGGYKRRAKKGSRRKISVGSYKRVAYLRKNPIGAIQRIVAKVPVIGPSAATAVGFIPSAAIGGIVGPEVAFRAIAWLAQMPWAARFFELPWWVRAAAVSGAFGALAHKLTPGGTTEKLVMSTAISSGIFGAIYGARKVQIDPGSAPAFGAVLLSGVGPYGALSAYPYGTAPAFEVGPGLGAVILGAD